MSRVRGRAWVYGDRIDTDLLAPGAYMKAPIDELARHCLEALDPNFAPGVRPGDILVAGRAFGIGSSREQAAQALKLLGVGAVLAQSFARIFYRNALNLGLPVLVLADPVAIAPGDELELDWSTGELRNRTRALELRAEPIPDFLQPMLRAGGLIPHLKQRFSGTAAGL